MKRSLGFALVAVAAFCQVAQVSAESSAGPGMLGRCEGLFGAMKMLSERGQQPLLSGFGRLEPSTKPQPIVLYVDPETMEWTLVVTRDIAIEGDVISGQECIFAEGGGLLLRNREVMEKIPAAQR